EGAEEVARLHPLGDHGATDARELSADAQQPCEAAHAVEPIARERAFHAPRGPPPRGMGRFQERRLPQAGAPVKTTIGRSSLFGAIGPLGIPAASRPRPPLAVLLVTRTACERPCRPPERFPPLRSP